MIRFRNQSNADRRGLCALLVAGLMIWGGDREILAEKGDGSRTHRIKEIIAQSNQEPVETSILKIGPLLLRSAFFIPKSQENFVDDAGQRRMGFLTGEDKMGRTWFYGYTDLIELQKVFPQRTGYIEMSFSDFFSIVESYKEVGGIFINSGSAEMAYPIPQAFFSTLKQLQLKKIN